MKGFNRLKVREPSALEIKKEEETVPEQTEGEETVPLQEGENLIDAVVTWPFWLNDILLHLFSFGLIATYVVHICLGRKT